MVRPRSGDGSGEHYPDSPPVKRYRVVAPVNQAARVEARRHLNVPAEQAGPCQLLLQNPRNAAAYFLDHIKRSRGDDTLGNLMVGKALYTVFAEAGQVGDGFDEWVQWNGANAGRRQLFDGFQEQPYPRTIRTLAYFCRLDQPEAYKAWLSEWLCDPIFHLIEHGASKTTLGAILARFAWLDFALDPAGKAGVLYYYDNHGWNEDETRRRLVGVMREQVIPLLVDYAQAILEERNASQERMKQAIRLKKIANEDLMRTFEVHVHEAELNLGLPRLKEKLLRDVRQVRFRNCVVETLPYLDDNGSAIFVRDGTPEDGLYKSTDLDYPKSWTVNSPEVQRYYEWMHMIWDDGSDLPWDDAHDRPRWDVPGRAPLVSEIMRADMASFASGGNPEKLYRFWVGHQNGSKSLLAAMLERAYQEYVAKMPVVALAGKPAQAGGTNSELAQTEGCRLVLSEETDANETLHGGRMKTYTGNVDSQYIRNLYERPRKMRLTWKPITQTNFDPVVIQGGMAFDSRAMVTEFPAFFTLAPPATSRERWRTRTHLRDLQFDQHLLTLAQAYWFDTVKGGMYERYIRDGTGPHRHPRIQQRTDQFNRGNNPVLAFAEARIQVQPHARATFHDVWNAYEDFFEQADIPKSAKVTRNAFRSDFSNWYRSALARQNRILQQDNPTAGLLSANPNLDVYDHLYLTANG